MLRTLILGTAFVGITAGLLIFQPGVSQLRDLDDRSTGDDAAVTRARTDADLTGSAFATEPAAGSAAAALSALVKQAQSAEAGAEAPAANPALAIAAAVKAAQGGGEDELTLTTRDLLAELSRNQPRGDNVALDMMTESVLAKLGGADTRKRAPAVLETLVVQALRQGQSDDYLDALLNEARDTGQIQVPDALITSDGKVDTATLLASLVQRSTGTSTVAAAAPAPVRTASVNQTRPQPRRVAVRQSYTVQPGDSLAAISVRFYGESFRYTAIFEANRDQITSPDRIRVGQVLTIPVL